MPDASGEARPSRWLGSIGGAANNLKNVTVDIPLGLFTCVTGVSGRRQVNPDHRDAVQGAVAEALQKPRESRRQTTSKASSISTRSSTSTSPRSGARRARIRPPIPASSRHIRDMFAQLPEAKLRGYKPGRFSFNVKGGRCEACQGDGIIKIEMHFLPDVYVHAKSARASATTARPWKFNYKGKIIADVLDMTVDAGADLFKERPPDPRTSSRPLKRCRPRLHPSRPVGDHAFRRRGAAGEAAKSCRDAPPAARSTSWTSRRPDFISTTSRSCSRCCMSLSTGQHGDRHRTQSRCDQDRRLDHRPGPGRRRRRRQRRGHRHAGGDRRQPAATPDNISSRSWTAAAAARPSAPRRRSD